MGHKVHPYGFRLGVSRTWTAKWYADNKEYTTSRQALVKAQEEAQRGQHGELVKQDAKRRADLEAHQNTIQLETLKGDQARQTQEQGAQLQAEGHDPDRCNPAGACTKRNQAPALTTLQKSCRDAGG